MRQLLSRIGQLLSRLYLVRCFRENKFLFIVICLFLALAAYDHRTGNEITPAFVFSMFSQKHVSTQGNFFLIRVNGGDTLNMHHTIDEPRRMMIFSTLSAYHDGQLAGPGDPHRDAVAAIVAKHPFMAALSRGACCSRADYERYLPWLLGYLRHAVDEKIERIDIEQCWFHYDAENLPVTDSLKPLYASEKANRDK
ncbi:MAG: hypothetical protein Q8927_06565 [Bacteroidota bacterium]|nr:hypothetical protein [Bacteroidota bacterium]MDP4215846.1 hypothetical protein [Bacteroidota bacterium]MDP4247335.1 hypothetical protein [Bacteroidota bacterium]MDP4255086.1 hypothetical protein [Bacteroidota bacterium]MDP4260418.1 hypothetical protein [Bacteroidota bacterium]